MAQDFAKQRKPDAARRKAPRAATRLTDNDGGAHWSWFLSGLTSGVILSIAAYLGMQKLEADAQARAQASSNGEGQVAELPVFDFGFYENLVNAEVTVNATPPATSQEPVPEPVTSTDTTTDSDTANFAAPVATATATPQQPAGSANQAYLLQAGSFQNRQEAENHRARIILLNLSAIITPGVVSGRTFYRVQVGPFSSRGGAEQARALLSENSIDSIPLLLR